MLTLALDTSTRAGSVAIVRDTTVLAVVPGDPARTHGERLPGEIEAALQQARVAPQDLQLLAVASGPGAFTGLRIGLATIQGLAMVLGVPVVAVSALDALALFARTHTAATGPGVTRGPSPSRVAAWMDAARGEVFAADYEGHEHHPMSVPCVAAADTLLAGIPPNADVLFVGDGAVRYSAQIAQRAPQRILEPPAALAPYIAQLGIEAARRGESGAPHALQPLYVRRPDAELERQRREAR